ncbi:glycosyl hydrolase, partial [Pseudoduganella sp. RAF53_2]
MTVKIPCLWLLSALPLIAACSGGAPMPAQAWITTGDQRMLLARQAPVTFDEGAPAAIVIDVDPATQYQEMQGFGAAITDASAWLIQHRLGTAQRDALLKDLFGTEAGLGLSFTRLTIGASDFSTAHYSFDDMPPGQSDPELKHFT